MRVNITIPDDWLPALQRAAAKRKLSLSRWLYTLAVEQLPKSERAKLPPAKGRGRPAKEPA
jgi:hypothetical protein